MANKPIRIAPPPIPKAELIKEVTILAIIKKNIAYYRIPVNFQIKGNFLGYIKFKRQVAMSQKMLNFDKETIKVIKGDTTSTVVVNGVLTIVGLPDEFF